MSDNTFKQLSTSKQLVRRKHQWKGFLHFYASLEVLMKAS